MVKKKFVKKEEWNPSEACCQGGNPFVSIPSSLGGIFLMVVVVFLIFAKDSAYVLNSIIWGFVVLGIVAMFFASRSKHRKRK